MTKRDVLKFRYPSAADCPDVASHQDPPSDMNAAGYSPTQKQVRCPTCGYWSRWLPRTKETAR